MTDRYSGFIVVLKQNLREDDAEQTLNALRQIRGVATVEPVVSEPSSDFVARTQERIRITNALYDALSKLNDRS